jgi:hypothetical protein
VLDPADLAALAEVAEPSSHDSPGALYLRDVAQEVSADLAEIGPSLHAVCLWLAAETAEPDDDEEAFAAFVDLGLWGENLPTRRALVAAGVRLAAALLARPAVGAAALTAER